MNANARLSGIVDTFKIDAFDPPVSNGADAFVIEAFEAPVSNGVEPEWNGSETAVVSNFADTNSDEAEFAWNGSGTGTTSNVATSSQDINGLLSATRWNTTSISFSFPTSATQYGSYSHLNGGTPTDETTTFAPVNAQMAAEARWVLTSLLGTSYASVSLLNTSENSGAPGSATLRIGMSASAQPTAYAYYPSASFVGGDVWMGTQSGGNAMTNPVRGNYAWHAMMHELGHALGLKHGQDVGGPANTAMTSAHDGMEYSIMTYRSYVGGPTTGYTNEQWGYAQSLMMYDIAAIQTMYGARFDATAHTYSWSATTGEEFIDGVGQGAPGNGVPGSNRVFMTVWDGSGAGTYDFSNYSGGSLIDLRPGESSRLSSAQLAYLGNSNYAHGNVYNALMYNNDTRSLIRNVYTGSGDDIIYGNDASNTIYDGGGSDFINSFGGRDVLVYNFASSAVTISHLGNGWLVTGSNWHDELYNVEALQFTDRTVVIRETSRHDFGGDTFSDILWRDSVSGSTIEWNMSDRTVLDSGGIGGNTSWSVIATGDFNGDGHGDVLWRDSATGTTIEWEMNGRTVLSSGGIGGNTDWSVVATGDFNGDGRTDILWRDAVTGTTIEWDMNGRTVLSSGGIGGNTDWSVIATGDFNGDGRTDILWRDAVTGSTIEWEMNDRTVVSSGGIGGNTDWRVIATGDFNGDGRTDILWRDGVTGTTIEWEMNGRTVVSSGGIGGNLSWSVIGTGDFNGDGNCDILWRDSASGSVIEWDMNGRTVVSSGAIGGDTNWRPIAV